MQAVHGPARRDRADARREGQARPTAAAVPTSHTTSASANGRRPTAAARRDGDGEERRDEHVTGCERRGLEARQVPRRRAARARRRSARARAARVGRPDQAAPDTPMSTSGASVRARSSPSRTTTTSIPARVSSAAGRGEASRLAAEGRRVDRDHREPAPARPQRAQPFDHGRPEVGRHDAEAAGRRARELCRERCAAVRLDRAERVEQGGARAALERDVLIGDAVALERDGDPAPRRVQRERPGGLHRSLERGRAQIGPCRRAPPRRAARADPRAGDPRARARSGARVSPSSASAPAAATRPPRGRARRRARRPRSRRRRAASPSRCASPRARAEPSSTSAGSTRSRPAAASGTRARTRPSTSSSTSSGASS